MNFSPGSSDPGVFDTYTNRFSYAIINPILSLAAQGSIAAIYHGNTDRYTVKKDTCLWKTSDILGSSNPAQKADMI